MLSVIVLLFVMCVGVYVSVYMMFSDVKCCFMICVLFWLLLIVVVVNSVVMYVSVSVYVYVMFSVCMMCCVCV